MSDTDRDARMRTQLEDTAASLEAATATNDAALVEIGPAPVPVVPPTIIADPLALDIAIASAAPGAVLTLATTLVYPAPLILRRPITLQSETYADRRELRMTVDEPAPRFLNGTDSVGDAVRLLGLEHRHTNILTDIVLMRGADNVLDRPRVLGDPVTGGKRGINYSGSAGVILHYYIDDIFQPAQDTQAIYSSSMGPGGLLIDDGWACAAGESIMFGGGDAGSEDRAPRRIVITRSTLTKKPAWLALVSGSFATGNAKHRQQCKNALEFKHAIDVVVDDCEFEYAGVSQGQSAALIVAGPRNQSGREPWTTIQNVVIRNCRGRHASSLLQIFGDDDVHPSGRLSGFTLTDCAVEDLNPAVYGAHGRIVYINRGPDQVTIDGLTASGTKLKSIVYFDEQRPPTGLVLRKITAPAGLVYAYHNPRGDTLASVKLFAPDAVLEV